MDKENANSEPEGLFLRLGWDEKELFKVDANLVATGRTCVIGASGSGKSYLVGVICEELCKNNVPFAIVDAEGEHSGLKEKYEAIWIGEEEGCDIKWHELDLDALAAASPDIAPLILDVSETDEPKEKVAVLLTKIYSEVERRRTPYLVIVEEADRFVPQNGQRVEILNEVARRGRKRGLGLMVCTQRPSLVDKNVLSQCGNQLIGKLVIRNDLQAVAQFFSGHELPKQLTTLPPGRFFALGGLSPVPKCITIRSKETRYGGGTPRLGIRVVKPFKLVRSEVALRPNDDGSKIRNREGDDVCLGFGPTIKEEDIPELVKRDKRYVLFGEEEVVAGAQLVYRPFAEVGVSVKTGLFKKRIETKFLILDGPTGRFVELRDSPVFYNGFERLLGLNDDQMEILHITKLDREMSLLEIANKLGISKETIRRPMHALEESRLVRVSRIGKTNLYRRLVTFPELRWSETELPLEEVRGAKDKISKSELDEEKTRQVVRGMIQHADVQCYRRFVYPFFRVELMLRRKKRVVWLDGRGGGEAHL